MKLTVLGSGSVLSSGKRAMSGYLVEGSQNALVVDLGPGSFLNLKKSAKTERLSCLLFTHIVHPDHVADLIAFLDERNALNETKGIGKDQVNIFGPKGLHDFLVKVEQLFPHFSHLPFKVKAEEMDYSEKKVFEFTVKSKPVKHVETTIGYRIESAGKVIAYSGDTAYCQEIIDLGRKADLLVLDCSCSEKKSAMHLNALECGEIAAKAGAKAVLLSHFFPEAEQTDLKALVSRNFNGEVLVAKDLMQVEV